MTEKQTLFDKIWSRHLVPGVSGEGLPSLLYVDLHLVHEVTSPQAFEGLRVSGRSVKTPIAYKNVITRETLKKTF